MSLFNNLFGGSNSASSELPEFWRKLESSEDLQSAIEKSSEKTIVIRREYLEALPRGQ